ncbi:MAG: hypothetical protein JO154_05390 [Chitinophaga sp.]|uniref:DUF7683 domain-containing protein n=1 Tax=Chitinophaga sp. TaxID=1869181 RepID=UPI0025B98150|nr:hypothetical protein [Chitinophaga sp.]MBV8252021.1 hypothetical protein [Chitinophaga sp.]
MEVTRDIICFSLDTEEEVFFRNIDPISLANLKEIFHPDADDPLMYYVYGINAREAEQLNKILKDKIEFDFEKCSYELHCHSVPGT